jgi:sugar/nucleoside kinase (ribokinase family)
MRIFLSSTRDDLKPYQQVVEQVVALWGEQYVGMEYFGAQPRDSFETCLRELEGCDLVVCLIGPRYGSIERKSGKSFVRLEMEHAHRRSIPALVYFIDPDYPIPPRFIPNDAERSRLESFKKWLSERYNRDTFTGPDNLLGKLAICLAKYFKDRAPGSDAFEEIKQRLQRPSSSKGYDVSAVTAHNLDVMHEVSYVAPDHEARIGKPREFPGGSGANTVFALGKLGRRVATAGIVADDGPGRTLIQSLAEGQVNADCVLRLESNETQTGRTFVFVDRHGRRSIYVNPGVNEIWCASLSAREHERSKLEQMLLASKIVHLSSFTGPDERNLQGSLIKGLDDDVVVSLTPGALYARLGLTKLSGLLKRTNLLFVYEHQLDDWIASRSEGGTANGNVEWKVIQLFHMLKKFREPLLVVVKKAIAPMAGVTAPESLFLAVGREDLEDTAEPRLAEGVRIRGRAEDSTGMGDAVAAGVMLGLLEGASLEKCANMAFAIAEFASRKLGARSGLPSARQLRAAID